MRTGGPRRPADGIRSRPLPRRNPVRPYRPVALLRPGEVFRGLKAPEGSPEDVVRRRETVGIEPAAVFAVAGAASTAAGTAFQRKAASANRARRTAAAA